MSKPIGALVFLLLWFALLLWGLVEGHSATLALPVVCNANEEPQATREDNYGTVTKLTCWRGSFNGSEVSVLFVD